MKKLVGVLFACGISATMMAGPLDTNGDAIDDLYFQNSVGQIFSWQLNGSGTAMSATFVHAGILADWRLVARADLNQDGTGDLIFQNSGGQIFGWLVSNAGFPFGVVSIYRGDGLADWRVRAAADLNNDRIPDLILQSTNGQVIGWIMNGAGGALFAVTIHGGDLGNWRIRAAADVNDDGIPDLILQNSESGHVVAWLMNGAAGATSNVTIYGADLIDWRLRAVADLNFDRLPDLVFQNSNGQIFGLLMGDAGSPIGGVNVWASALADWQVF